MIVEEMDPKDWGEVRGKLPSKVLLPVVRDNGWSDWKEVILSTILRDLKALKGMDDTLAFQEAESIQLHETLLLSRKLSWDSDDEREQLNLRGRVNITRRRRTFTRRKALSSYNQYMLIRGAGCGQHAA